MDTRSKTNCATIGGFARAFAALAFAAFAFAGNASAQMDTGAGMLCSSGTGHGGAYFLKDFQYYKPMIADIREPSVYIRHYWNDESVRYAQRTTAGSAGSNLDFIDVGYGKYFPFLGWNADVEAPENCLEANGFALFLMGSGHSLFDMDTRSHDLLNTDYRVGFGLAARFARHLAVRLQVLHESTHIGDEYTLGAIADPDFRRYNVSYEAFEGFVAWDRYDAILDEFPDRSLSPVYLRVYGGGRLLASLEGGYQEFDRMFEAFDLATGQAAPDPLLVGSAWEGNVGGEAFWDLVPLPDESDGGFLRRLISPQYSFLAGDLAIRDRYDAVAPERRPSLHVMAGVLYGAYFRGERTVRWSAHYYDGVHPHGQFRAEEISYWAVSFSVLF